ncbi:MAG: hypothetical protein JXA10_08440 [Anaerolineae bacterium]|nr:hypothetical protein [Anaerolineae bacterium]
MLNKSPFLVWLLAVIVPVFAIGPALTMSLEEAAIDTAVYHTYRTVIFAEAQQDMGGLALPRWTQAVNGNLGGPLFAYTPGLMYYLMAGFHTLGVDFALTWRTTTAALLIAASLGMTGLGLALFRRADAALVGAAMYVYAPLFLRDFFDRGTPQAVGMALVPWVLWALIGFMRYPAGWRFAFLALSWGLLLFAHNLTAVIFAPVIGVFLVIAWLYPQWYGQTARNPYAQPFPRTQTSPPHPRSACGEGESRPSLPAGRDLGWGRLFPRHLIGAVLALVAGSLLAAFYILPIAAELQYVQIDNPEQTSYADPAANPSALSDLWALPPVLDTGVENDSMGESVGPLRLIAPLIGLGLAVWFWRLRRQPAAILIAFLSAWSLLMIALQTESATFVWETITALDIMQFRFRLLNVVGFSAAVIAGYVFSDFLRWEHTLVLPYTNWLRWRGVLAGGLIAVLIVMQLPSLYPELRHQQRALARDMTSADVVRITTQTGTASLTSFDEFVPQWRHMPFTFAEAQRAAASPIANLPDDAVLMQVTRSNGHWSLHLDTPQAFTAAFYLLYYPGWAARIDGAKAPIGPATDNSGYLLLDVPAGAHTITLDYVGTTAQHIGDWITILTALGLVLVAALWRSKTVQRADYKKSANPHPQPFPRKQGKEEYHAPLSSSLPAGRDLGWGQPISTEARPVTHFASGARVLVIAGLVLALAGLKTWWIDPHTTLFRHTSTCASIHGIDHYPQVVFSASPAANIEQVSGDQFILCGYDPPPTSLAPGDTFTVTLYWQTPATPQTVLSNFAHLVGENFNPQTGNPIWSQQDNQLPAGHLTTDWLPDVLYRDTFKLTIPDQTPPGSYQLEIGWYTRQDGQRWPPTIIPVPDVPVTLSDWDSLILATITVD